jgi:hypothetical protein
VTSSLDISYLNESGLFGDAVITSTPARGGSRISRSAVKGRPVSRGTALEPLPEIQAPPNRSGGGIKQSTQAVPQANTAIPSAPIAPITLDVPNITEVPDRAKPSAASASINPENSSTPDVQPPLWPSFIEHLWVEVHQVASQRRADRQAITPWYLLPLIWLSSLYDIIQLSWARFGYETLWRLPLRVLGWLLSRPWIVILLISLVFANNLLESDAFITTGIGYRLRHYGVYDAKDYVTSFVPHYISRPLDYFNEDDVLDLQKRMSDIEHKVATLNRRANFDTATLNYLKDNLPDFVLIKRDKQGNKVIPPNFWSALKAKIEAEPPLLKGQFFSPSRNKAVPNQELSYLQVQKIAAGAWAEFLDINEVKIKAWQGEVFDDMWQHHVQDAYKNDILVSRTEMIEEVHKAWDDSKSLINNEISRFAKQMERFLREQEKVNRTLSVGDAAGVGIPISKARAVAREEAKKFGFVTEKEARRFTQEELKKLESVNERKVYEIANQVMQNVAGVGQVEARAIAKEELQQLETAKKSKAKDLFVQELKSNEKYIKEQARSVAQQEIKGAISKVNAITQNDVRTISLAEIERMVPLVQIRSLIKTQMGKNVEQAKRRVNYFSVGVGVIVNPIRTSPSYAFNTKRAWIGTRALLYVLGSGIPTPKPPVEALTRWDEHGDCWCAPSSEYGISLGLYTSKPLYPDEIVIEHISPEATLDAGTTPKDMILFAKIKGYNQQVIAGKLSEQFFSNVIGSSINDLDESWVPLAVFKYDLASGESTQAFQIPVDLKGLNIPASEFVVRAMSNWGRREYTCLYRVRLHGEVATITAEN